MHPLIHAILLFATGFCLVFTFLALTRPPPGTTTTTTLPRRPHCSSSSSSSSSTKNPNNAATTTATTPRRPPFWETMTAAEVAAVKRTALPAEFAVPAHDVPSPIAPVFFLHQPKEFVKLFRDCENDDDCYITYHHVPKTGGTTIESALAQVFGQRDESSCCGEWTLHLFHQNTTHFCNNKFTSWQMDYDLYFEVLDTCFQRQYNKNKKRRVLMLISIREPVATTLSFIHQRCNKNWERRNAFIQEACMVCQYEEHRKVWDRFADLITGHMEGAWKVLRVLQDDARHAAGNVSALPVDRLQVAVMEPNDIDLFLNTWHPEMNFSKANAEILNRCYFRMTKEYIDKLGPAAEWYRRFVSGVAS